MGKRSAEQNFQEFKEAISQRVSRPGPVTTGQIWDLLRRDGWSYSYITDKFKRFMDSMIEDGRAERLGRGFWNIFQFGVDSGEIKHNLNAKIDNIDKRIQDLNEDVIFWRKRLERGEGKTNAAYQIKRFQQRIEELERHRKREV